MSAEPASVLLKRRVRLLLLMTCVLILDVPWAFAQMNTGDIGGLGSDPSGGVVEGASVDAVNLESQRKFNSVTNAAGQYLPSQIPPGAYTLTANLQGFQQAFAGTLPLSRNE